MQYQKVIEQLGYSPKEAKVYLASLRLGEAHISDIALKASMPRTTVQTIVNRLQKDGLMNFYVMRRNKYWVAQNPERFLDTLKKKEETIEDALPALKEMRKIAQQKAKKQNRKLNVSEIHICASNSLQPMLVSDASGDIQFVNEAWEKLFGYTLSEVQGRHTNMLASGETDPAVYTAMWRKLAKGQLFQTDNVIDRRKDGSTFKMQTTIFALEHGGEMYYVQVLQEVKN